jgi:hypothetical protein
MPSVQHRACIYEGVLDRLASSACATDAAALAKILEIALKGFEGVPWSPERLATTTPGTTVASVDAGLGRRRQES